MRLRAAESADVPAMVEVQRVGALRSLTHIFPQETYPFPRAEVESRWLAEVADPAVAVYVIEHDDGTVAGFAALRGNQLLHFGTAVQTWGTGLAAAAHDLLLDEIRATNAPHARLRVLVDNRRARRFYEKLGWRCTESVSRSPFPPFPVLVEYRRPLWRRVLSPAAELATDRLVLRRWRDGDRGPFAALNADPEVTEHLPGPLTRAESDMMIERMEGQFDECGFGLWAVEVAGTGEFIGFTGLSVARFAAHFTPAVEVGWRLARRAWGHGYATEAARRALAFGFGQVGLPEIVSFTATGNSRSRAVMARLGMTHDPADDFAHPLVPEGSPLRRHVLYRLRRSAP